MGRSRPCARAAVALMAGLAAFAGHPAHEALAQATKTLKEQLSDKASDNQRVDNCHVPPERRGPAPRPDCPAASTSANSESRAAGPAATISAPPDQ